MAVLARYSETLLSYCRSRNEENLYEASLISDACIRDGIGPDDIVAAHLDAMQTLMGLAEARPGDKVRVISGAHQFLLEMMIGYGVKYREYLELKLADAARDADELVRLERARAEHAVKSEAEKVEMLGVIAHELGTPLTIARGNAAVLNRMLVADGSPVELAASLQDLTSAIDRLVMLASHIVAASNDAEPEVAHEPQGLRRIAERCVGWASMLGKEKGVTVRSSCMNDLWVTGDEDGLMSLMTNLLQNAVRYTRTGGEVRLECCDLGDVAVIEVSDNGIGMTESVRARIFEKFYRAPEARRLSASGLGMGLVIVQRLVAALQGRLEVETAEGKGTTFRVFLPKATDIEEEKQA